MMAHRPFPRATAIIACLAILPAVMAVWGAVAQPAGQPTVEPPEIGETMIFQQLRHAKLWFAGKAGNWPLADYQVKELREGFETVSKYYPTFNNIPLATMIDTIRDTNFTELDKAIADRDRAKFARAYDRLTQACNACHQASELGFISIQRPTMPPFSNQSYAPKK